MFWHAAGVHFPELRSGLSLFNFLLTFLSCRYLLLRIKIRAFVILSQYLSYLLEQQIACQTLVSHSVHRLLEANCLTVADPVTDYTCSHQER